MGLEGLVSKRRDRPYRSGRSKDWVKVKNGSHDAYDRVKDSFLRPAVGRLENSHEILLAVR
jgi:bifunctional non-homologous end joining protein LigD